MAFSNRARDRREEFPAQVYLGADGLGYIATLDVSRDEARRFVKRIAAVKPADVEKFFADGDRQSA